MKTTLILYSGILKHSRSFWDFIRFYKERFQDDDLITLNTSSEAFEDELIKIRERFLKKETESIRIFTFVLSVGEIYAFASETAFKVFGGLKGVTIVKPLLSKESRERMAEALGKAVDVQQEEQIFLLGHGSRICGDHDWKAFAALLGKIWKNRDVSFAMLNDDLGKAGLSKEKVLHLVPVFLTKGRHLTTDIMGEDDGIVRKLKESGYNVKIETHSLTEYDIIGETMAEIIHG